VKVVFVFDHFGPYHLARISAAAKVPEWDVWGIELHPKSRTYAWDSSKAAFGFHKISLPNVGLSGSAERFALLPHLEEALASCLPDVVFVNGWGDFMSLETIRWAKKQGVRLVVMSETRRVDGERSWWGEWVKSRIVSLCDAGLCGGESHRRYLGELGLPKDRVALGYNAVDNEFFAAAKNFGIDLRAMWPQEGGTTKGTNLYELGGDQGAKSFGRGVRSFEPRIAQINTDSELRNDTKSGNQSDAQGTCAGAAFSNPFTSELERDSENTSLIPSADGSAFLPATAPEAPASPYFLASNRFVERKNLGRLIRAYAKYVGSLQEGKEAWSMVLLGDGELRVELEELCAELGLRTAGRLAHGGTENTKGECLKLNYYKLKTLDEGGCVVFAGFRQVEELPFFYGGAGVFIHPALSEPWGLVINEAMASGLPILSSKNVGAAEELLQLEVNGFSFDPTSVEELATVLQRMAKLPRQERAAMGAASKSIISNWGPERFAQGVREAVRMAMSRPLKCAGILDRLLLEILIRK
jgi:glycosyltransferase involved in cell wall biosynthesis